MKLPIYCIGRRSPHCQTSAAQAMCNDAAPPKLAPRMRIPCVTKPLALQLQI